MSFRADTEAAVEAWLASTSRPQQLLTYMAQAREALHAQLEQVTRPVLLAIATPGTRPTEREHYELQVALGTITIDLLCDIRDALQRQ